MRLKPAAALTMPNTRTQALTRSRSPRARCRLAEDAERCQACRFIALLDAEFAPRPCPAAGRVRRRWRSGRGPMMNARRPTSRTHGKGSTTPGGSLAGGGSDRPRSCSFCSMRAIGLSPWRGRPPPPAHSAGSSSRRWPSPSARRSGCGSRSGSRCARTARTATPACREKRSGSNGRAEVDHGRVAADGGEVAVVAVAEGLGRLARDAAQDVRGRGAAHLLGTGRDAGHRRRLFAGLVAHRGRQVADHADVGMARQAQVGQRP